MATTRNSADRPLSARSVVASTLLGMRPPRLSTQMIVRSGAIFGIAEGTTRVAVSRMVAAGELVADGDGYRLAGPMLTRQARQDVSRSGPTARWDGTWTMQVVLAEPRDAPDRARLRAAATALRLAPLREGVWARPANLPSGVLPDDEAIVAAQCRAFSGQPEGDPVALAAELWDLEQWTARAVDLRARLKVVGDRLTTGDLDALPDGFVLSAATLRHFQADPLLPAELLPRAWPGDALRADYERYDEAFRAVWSDWYRAQRGRMAGGAPVVRP
ncbi:MAG: PaaX domain-containing protein, C- domain protein [Acidimicrobiia bacterium]|nr:PaaX domain-containing protein, C- domain protein [Acidimicrobiia bacterium]